MRSEPALRCPKTPAKPTTARGRVLRKYESDEVADLVLRTLDTDPYNLSLQYVFKQAECLRFIRTDQPRHFNMKTGMKWMEVEFLKDHPELAWLMQPPYAPATRGGEAPSANLEDEEEVDELEEELTTGLDSLSINAKSSSCGTLAQDIALSAISSQVAEPISKPLGKSLLGEEVDELDSELSFATSQASTAVSMVKSTSDSVHQPQHAPAQLPTDKRRSAKRTTPPREPLKPVQSKPTAAGQAEARRRGWLKDIEEKEKLQAEKAKMEQRTSREARALRRAQV